MSKTKRVFFIFFLILISVVSGQGQDQKAFISLQLSNSSFSQFIESLEAKSNYRFLYNIASFDSLRITVSVQNKTLEEILDQVFNGTDFKYGIDVHKNVYLTVGRPLLTELPFDFFNEGLKHGNENQSKETIFQDYEAVQKNAEEKIVTIGLKTTNLMGTANIAGTIKSSKTGEPVIGASVYIEKPLIGVATNEFGYFSITLPKGKHELKIKSIDMKSSYRKIMLYADGKLNIELQEDVTPLKEIIVESERDVKVMGLQMGVEKMDLKTLKQIPVALGEADIFKAILTLPGVQSVGEGTVGFNVRGGATDQNLILLNDAPIYNPSHLFGFFSAFNPDILKSVELFKSGIPAEYGGRISSVLDVTTREGNKKKFGASGGIGPVTGRLSLEGPIIKDKTSFLIGGRSTYSDWILRKIPSPTLKNSAASFYDVNIILSHEMNVKNSFYASAYISKDDFKLTSDTTYTYSNQNGSIKWKHVFGNKFYSVVTGSYSSYGYSVASDANKTTAFKLSYGVAQTQGKADFTYFFNSRHLMNFGLASIYYNLLPGQFEPIGNESLVKSNKLQAEQGLENAAYVSDYFEINPRLSIYTGLRYSYFTNLGPRNVITYSAGLPKSENTMVDTLTYPAGKRVASYGGPEYRLSARYIISGNTSLKVSFNRMRQYIHVLSNTSAISPTDIWKLSDPYIKPLVGDQISIGYYKNSKVRALETSVEMYYKAMENYLDYKGGARLIMNPHIETDVISTTGKSYGIELMVKKLSGKLNGWVSYTYARSLLKTKDANPSELINQGKFYPSNFDKPHSTNFIGNYKFSRRVSISLNVTYSTGRPITLPLAKYELGGAKRLFYSERNQYRIPDYFRMDLSMNLEGNHKVRKLAHSSWTLGVYNLTGRQNPYSVYFTSQNGTVKGYQLSVFPKPIPTITYNFKF